MSHTVLFFWRVVFRLRGQLLCCCTQCTILQIYLKYITLFARSLSLVVEVVFVDIYTSDAKSNETI